MRKTLVAVFLVCLLSSALADETTCSFRNLYTNHLIKKGVVFNQNPVKNSVSCGNEWNTFGSCCSKDQIDSLVVSNEKKELIDLYASAQMEVDATYQNMYGYMRSFESTQKRSPAQQKTNQVKTNGRKPANQAANHPKSDDKDKQTVPISQLVKTQMLPILHWVNSNKNNIIQEQGICLKKLHEERANSHCYACSGRAALFFQGDKLRIHEMTCRAIIVECSRAWTLLISFLDNINRLNDVVRYVEVKQRSTQKRYPCSH